MSVSVCFFTYNDKHVGPIQAVRMTIGGADCGVHDDVRRTQFIQVSEREYSEEHLQV